MIDGDTLKLVNNRLRFLATGFLVEKGIEFYETNLIGFKDETASKKGLKKHWQNKINLDINTILQKIGGVGLVLSFFYFLPIIIGFVFYLVGYTDNGFYRYLFDEFTVIYLFSYFVAGYIFAFLSFVIDKGFEFKLFLYSLLGFLRLGDIIGINKPRFINRLMLLFFGVAVVHLFLPFHNIIINVVMAVYYLFSAMFLHDFFSLNFAFFDIDNLKKVQKYLNES